MGFEEQLAERRRQLEGFNRWEEATPSPQRDVADILGDAGTILSWLFY